MPENEEARLAARITLKILDTEAEERFDRIARMAPEAFNVSIVLVGLIDRDRQ